MLKKLLATVFYPLQLYPGAAEDQAEANRQQAEKLLRTAPPLWKKSSVY